MPAPPPSFSAEVLLDALEPFAEVLFVAFPAVLPPAAGVVAFVSTGDFTVTLAKKPGENGFATQPPAVGTGISFVASVVAGFAQLTS